MLISFNTQFTSLHVKSKLISIGCISEDGREFYAEMTDDLANQLRDWLESFGEPVTLACDSFGCDWRWIKKLYPTSKKWPANLAKNPEITIFIGDVFSNAVEAAFNQGLRRYHALDCAKANRIGWQVCLNIPLTEPRKDEKQTYSRPTFVTTESTLEQLDMSYWSDIGLVHEKKAG